MAQYTFFAPREDFISGNREGVFSCFSYLAIQLIGIGIGRLLYEDVIDPKHLKLLEGGKSANEVIKVAP